jgi:AraC-like DNA-binding protein
MFLIGPLYFLYVKTIFGYSFNIRRDVLHAIPIIVCIILISPFYAKSFEVKLAYILNANSLKVNLPASRLIGYGFLMLHIAVYLMLSTRFVLQQRLTKLKNYASLKKWIRVINVGMILFAVNYCITYSIYLFTSIQSTIFLDITHLVITFFIHLVAYSMIYVLGSNSATPISKAPVIFSESQSQDIMKLTEIEKVYLNPSLKMADVATAMNVTPQRLSEIINSQYGKSFTEFINEFRVKEASRILRDNKHRRYDLDGIAELCGFRNRTTLTRVFKKHTKLSPTQFRNAPPTTASTI